MLRLRRFNEKIKSQTLAKELAEIIYPLLSAYLYKDVNSHPNPLSEEEMLPELTAILKSLFKSRAVLLAAITLLDENLVTGTEIRNSMYQAGSPINSPKWKELNNNIAEFIITHTITGEHVYVPERGLLVLEKLFEVLRDKINENTKAEILRN